MRKLLNEELNRLTTEEFKSVDKIPVVIVLDNVRSMNNIGSIFRTSDAFRISSLMLCGITACPPHKDIHKTALGATESVSWEYFENTQDALKTLKNEGYEIGAIEQTEGSISIDKFKVDTQKKYALVFGHEVRGVQQRIVDKSDFALEIPQFGTKHSLNISVCAGIVIWHFYNQFSGAIMDMQ